MGKKIYPDKSANAEFKKELDVLLEITSKMQKQLEKGECVLLTFKEAANYLGCSDSFLYKLTSSNVIPCYKPHGRLYFFQHELAEWVTGRETKTINDSKE